MVDKPTKSKKTTASSQAVTASDNTIQHQQWISQSIVTLRVLLLDALMAGKYLSTGAEWRPHYTGEVLYFADRVLGVERPAVLVLAEEVTEAMVQESVESDFRSYVIVGGRLSEGVDLGKSRLLRVGHTGEMGEHYWATFLLDGEVLVTLGTPLSWCRLVGEILNAHLPTPFVQRRICAYCHALNEYRAGVCVKCGKGLMATGRLE